MYMCTCCSHIMHTCTLHACMCCVCERENFVFLHAYVCIYVCVTGRERERENEFCAYECICMCVRMRERTNFLQSMSEVMVMFRLSLQDDRSWLALLKLTPRVGAICMKHSHRDWRSGLLTTIFFRACALLQHGKVGLGSPIPSK